jgi:elongation factor P
MVTAYQMRPGMVIRFEGAPCWVFHARHLPGQGKGDGIVLARLRNVITRESKTLRLDPALNLKEVSVETKSLCYLYEDAEQFWFMESQHFGKVGLPKDLLGKRKPFLEEGVRCWWTLSTVSLARLPFRR